MKITKISYSLDATVNMGDYENYRPNVSAEANLEAGESPIEAMAELKRFVQTQLMEDIKKLKASRNK